MEETLPAGGSCLLGSINLSSFVVNPFKPNAYFDATNFEKTVREVVDGMNEVLNEGLQLHPLNEQIRSVSEWRQIGIGVMGLADMFIKLSMAYGDNNSIDISNMIGKTMINNAIKQSALLAKEYGCYPKFNKEAIMQSQFLQENAHKETIDIVKEYGLRNSQLLTCAPTGSISTMLGISGGLEPHYSLSYNRKTESLHEEERVYKVYAPIVKEFMLSSNDYNENNLPDYFVTAMNLNYKNRIDMQSTWQKYIDASISSTVNVPNNFTIEDTEKLYMYAWEKGLKGVTIYRDGCDREGILSIDDDQKNINSIETNKLPRGFIESVPEDLVYRKYKLKNGCGNLYFFVGVDEHDGKIYDVFTNTDAVGGCTVNTQANSRLLSAGLRGGVPLEYLITQLEKSGSCASYQSLRGRQQGMTKVKNMLLDEVNPTMIEKIDKMIGTPVSAGKSCPSSIAVVLKSIIKEFANEEYEPMQYDIATKEDVKQIKKILVEECNHPNLIRTEGCVSCPDCGWSRCG